MVSNENTVYPKLLGVHEGNNIEVHIGKYGEYLKHNNEKYCIPSWARRFDINLVNAINVIDYKNMERQRKKVYEESIARETMDSLSNNMDRHMDQQKRLENRQETSKNYYRNSYF
jgi:topoisomerase IA-like protein